MKELSIEEKAKAYDEAIERAKNFIENGDEREKTIAESIFAGLLEESEDERIRKDLIENLSNCGWTTMANHPIKDIIAWLEKQGEQINYNEELKKCKENPLYFYDKYCKIKIKGQKPAEWSEEDDDFHFKSIESTIEYCKKEVAENDESRYLFDEDLKWLKFLKDRMIPQPKQVWSEDDEKQARQIERIVHDDGCTQKLQKQIDVCDSYDEIKNKINKAQKGE